jgi:hypothetical protein
MQCIESLMEEILSCSLRDPKKVIQIPTTKGWKTVSDYLRDRKDRRVIVSFHPIFGACVLSIRAAGDPCVLRYVENERNVEIDDATPCFETMQDHYVAKKADTFSLINMLRVACGQAPFEKISDALEIPDIDFEGDSNDDEWPPPRRVA